MKCKETVKLEKGPAHEILVLIAYPEMSPLNAQADVLSGTSGLNFIPCLHVQPNYVYTSPNYVYGTTVSKHMLRFDLTMR